MWAGRDLDLTNRSSVPLGKTSKSISADALLADRPLGKTSKSISANLLLDDRSSALGVARRGNPTSPHHPQLNATIYAGEQTNQFLKAESLQVPVLKIGHARLINTQDQSEPKLSMHAELVDDYLSQLFLQPGNGIIFSNHRDKMLS